MTKTEAETQLQLWIDADTAISTGKAYTIGNRALTRADASEVKDKMTYWQRVVYTLDAHDKGITNPGIRVATWK